MIFLTTVDPFAALSAAIANAISAAISLGIILLIIRLIILIAMVALITWIVKMVWYAGENRGYKNQQKKWKQQQKEWRKWQAKQDRIDSEMWDSHHRQKSSSANSKADKFANNPDWKWDEKSQLWRHRSQWDKMK